MNLRGELRKRLLGPLCVCVSAVALSVGCPGAPKQVVYDLARRTAIAERWSAADVVLFGTPSAEPHLAEGFYTEAAGGLRQSFAWARREAELSLTWRGVAPRAALLDMAPYRGVTGQSVEVRLNGAGVGSFPLNDLRHRYRVSLPAENQRPGENRLRFVFKAAASPADEDPGSTDRRQLSAAFYSLTVGSADDPALDDLLGRDAPRPFEVAEGTGLPSLVQVGPSVVRYSLRLPERAELRFVPTLHPAARAAAGAASFRVTIEARAGEEREVWSRVVAAREPQPREVVVTLPGTAGSIVRLGLHVGGASGGRFAWGIWEAPRLLGSGPVPSLEPTPFTAEEDRRGDALRKSLAGSNVLLIVLDAARAREFGCYGYSRPTTPEIDRIASEGIVFEDAHTPAVYTLGAMSSVWTSEHPHLHHSAVSFSSRLPKETLTLAEVLSARGVLTAGFVANAMAGGSFGLDRGFGEFHEVFREGSDADVLRKAVTPWLEASRERRFFVYLHFREPHFPYDPPPPFDTRFGPDGPIPKSVRRDLKWLTEINQGKRKASPEEIAHLVRLYDGGLAFADQEIGALRRAMEAGGLWDKTVVIVSADHGEALQEHGFIGHNVQLYDESVRIPLIMRLPPGKGPAGLRVKGLVDLVDLAPTIADVFGVLGQGGSDKEFRGRSLLPVVGGAPGKPALLSRTVWDRPRYALRDSHLKFVYDTRTGEEELFDLQADAGEARNLVSSDPLRAAYYRQALQHWISEASLRKRRSEEAALPTAEQCANLKALGYVVAECETKP